MTGASSAGGNLANPAHYFGAFQALPSRDAKLAWLADIGGERLPAMRGVRPEGLIAAWEAVLDDHTIAQVAQSAEALGL